MAKSLCSAKCWNPYFLNLIGKVCLHVYSSIMVQCVCRTRVSKRFKCIIINALYMNMKMSISKNKSLYQLKVLSLLVLLWVNSLKVWTKYVSLQFSNNVKGPTLMYSDLCVIHSMKQNTLLVQKCIIYIYIYIYIYILFWEAKIC